MRYLGQLIKYCFFHVPKTRFAIALECFTNGVTQPFFDDVIRIEEGELQPSGELAPDGGFTGTRETDKCNQSNAPSATGQFHSQEISNQRGH